ncbi:MAG: hypothetical protein E2P03_03130 [Acidobacteria bacterium]|nr:MAG: hypothetical protein E2P03_03130 [Acidobacteriota bacterium]
MSDISLHLLLATALSLTTACCGGGSTRDLDPETLSWVDYTHSRAGYSLSLPAAMRPDEEGDSVFFRYDAGVPVLVRLTTEEEARHAGVWFGHEAAGAITLDGRAGERFTYVHWDGPFATRTIAYVVPVGDRFLGLEFRTATDLDPVQEKILASFRLP